MRKVRCTARETRHATPGPHVYLDDRGLMTWTTDPTVRWICDVAHYHPTADEATECNARTVLVNPLHATHGHGAP